MSHYQINFENYADKFTPHFLFNYDFDIRNNDIYSGDSSDQDSHFILILDKGQLRYDVQVGVGIYKNLNGNINKLELKKVIRQQLEADGFKVSDIHILTYDDAVKAKITDSELMKILKQNNFVIDIDISR